MILATCFRWTTTATSARNANGSSTLLRERFRLAFELAVQKGAGPAAPRRRSIVRGSMKTLAAALARQAAYITPPMSEFVGPGGFKYNPGTALNDRYKGAFFLWSFRAKGDRLQDRAKGSVFQNGR